MPTTHDPDPPKAGPGSAFNNTVIQHKARKRRKKKAKTTTTTTSDELIGEDLLEWKDEGARSSSTKKKVVIKTTNDAKKKKTKAHVTPSSTPKMEPRSTTTTTHARHGLAVDTRALDTEQGRMEFDSFRTNALGFLQTLSNRGVAPVILGTSHHVTSKTARKSPRSNARGAMEAKAVPFLLEENLLAPVPIRPPLNASNVQNRKAVHVPKRLLAHDSWKLLSDLVVAVAQEDCDRNSTSTVPLDVTLVTNDIAFLGDTKQDCHKRGLNRFWDKIRPLFQNNAVRSIDLVICMTQDSSEDSPTDETQDSPTGESLTDNNNKIAATIQAIRDQFTKRAEADYKTARASNDTTTPVTISVTTIRNNYVEFQEVARKWIARALALEQNKGTILLDLPETLDGMQCTLSFEATYKVFPFRANSFAAAGLLEDLKLLTQSTFEVMQLVSVDSIDAALIVGVPMILSASLEDDLIKYNEMKSLVGCLLRYLGEKDVALVLRSKTNDEKLSSNVEPLYHMDGQVFLLMAGDFPGRNDVNDFCGNSRAGFLFRFASAEQIVDISNKVGVATTSSDSIQELSEYVENALDPLESNAMNPLLVPQKEQEPMYSTTKATGKDGDDEDAQWADTSGVGSRARANSSDSDDDDDLDTPWEETLGAQAKSGDSDAPKSSANGTKARPQENPFDDDEEEDDDSVTDAWHKFSYS